MKTYEEFRAAIIARESKGDYSVINTKGFMGAYQFGMARLCDLGLTRRISVGSKGLAHSLFEWIPPMTREKFLADRELQDKCFDRHVHGLALMCARICPENLSGAIAACHLKGVGGMTVFVRHQVDSVDAYGTAVSEYFNEFEGYEIPGFAQPEAPPIAQEWEFEHLSPEEILELEERGELPIACMADPLDPWIH